MHRQLYQEVVEYAIGVVMEPFVLKLCFWGTTNFHTCSLHIKITLSKLLCYMAGSLACQLTIVTLLMLYVCLIIVTTTCLNFFRIILFGLSRLVNNRN